MKNIKSEKNIFTSTVTLIFVGIVICFISLCIAKFDLSVFEESGEHVWYRTVIIDDPFMIGIGE